MGRYNLIDELGSGGMGAVFRAEDSRESAASSRSSS